MFALARTGIQVRATVPTQRTLRVARAEALDDGRVRGSTVGGGPMGMARTATGAFGGATASATSAGNTSVATTAVGFSRLAESAPSVWARA